VGKENRKESDKTLYVSVREKQAFGREERRVKNKGKLLEEGLIIVVNCSSNQVRVS